MSSKSPESGQSLYEFFLGHDRLVDTRNEENVLDAPSLRDTLFSDQEAHNPDALPSEDPLDYIFAIGEAGGNLEGLGTLVTFVERSFFMAHGHVHSQFLESRIYRHLPSRMEEIEPSLFACEMPLGALTHELERKGFEHSDELQEFVFRNPGRAKNDDAVRNGY